MWYNEFTVKIFCRMDFSNYPFDDQECKFKMGSTAFESNQIVLRSDYEFSKTLRPTDFQVRRECVMLILKMIMEQSTKC